MEHIHSWEVRGRSASEEIPHLLWNINVQDRFYKIPPLDSILN